jgi:hypothetical protein
VQLRFLRGQDCTVTCTLEFCGQCLESPTSSHDEGILICAVHVHKIDFLIGSLLSSDTERTPADAFYVAYESISSFTQQQQHGSGVSLPPDDEEGLLQPVINQNATCTAFEVCTELKEYVYSSFYDNSPLVVAVEQDPCICETIDTDWAIINCKFKYCEECFQERGGEQCAMKSDRIFFHPEPLWNKSSTPEEAFAYWEEGIEFTTGLQEGRWFEEHSDDHCRLFLNDPDGVYVRNCICEYVERDGDGNETKYVDCTFLSEQLGEGYVFGSCDATNNNIDPMEFSLDSLFIAFRPGAFTFDSCMGPAFIQSDSDIGGNALTKNGTANNNSISPKPMLTDGSNTSVATLVDTDESAMNSAEFNASYGDSEISLNPADEDSSEHAEAVDGTVQDVSENEPEMVISSAPIDFVITSLILMPFSSVLIASWR